MAISSSAPTTINKFLGLNMSNSGETQLLVGESPYMKNFKITKDNKLQKMYGYNLVCTVGTGIIRAIGKYKINNTDYLILVTNGKVYRLDSDYNTTELGTLTDDITSIFAFNNKIYFINGHEYKVYDGSTLSNVVGYIPLVRISVTPEGIGTKYEQANLLTNKRRQTSSPDGEATDFYIVDDTITSIDEVYVNGILQTSGYTKDVPNKKITFSVAPLQGVDTIEIRWTGQENQLSDVYSNKYVKTYGLADDTRVFMYGNTNANNRVIYSDLNAMGVPDVTYFPSNNFIDVGNSNYPVTNISRQYDRLIINKENETYYSYYEGITDTTGKTIISFPTYPLNDAHGMIAYGQGQLLDNYVTTIDTSIVMWTSTNNKDERNATIISTKVQEWLNEKDLKKSITMDYQPLKEYWLAIDNEILIYNYENGCYSLLNLPINVKYLYCNESDIYMGDNSGNVYIWNEAETTYNGEIIDSRWESNYMDFGADYLRKTMRKIWVTLKAFSKTSLRASYVSDKNISTNDMEIEMNLTDFNYMDFANFVFNTNNTIKPFRIKMKAKKFSFLKIIIENSKRIDKVLINSLTISKTFGSENK